jgi:hypothetical protein
MTPSDRDYRRTGRRLALALDRLESRELLTVRPVYHVALMSPRPVVSPITVGQPQGISGTVKSDASATPSQSDLGPPTPNELARQRFVSKMAGTFETAPGRFLNQPVQSRLMLTGGSNQALRLQTQMQFFLYSIPGRPPDGQIAMMPKDVATTGSQLVLDLTADPNSIVHGLLPTHFTWTVNGLSSGYWGGATGEGTLDASYTLYRAPHGVHSRGTVAVTIQGLVVNNHGLTTDTFIPGNRSQTQKPGF